MDDQSGWCTVESDPGVFTELVEKIGVKGVEFQEVFGFDDPIMCLPDDVLGLIFLFKFKDRAPRRSVMEYTPQNLFFAKQVINNACATQAILSILLNISSDQAEIGPTLTELRDFTEGLDDESRGLAIGNSEVIRSAHNSFRPSVSLEIHQDEDKQKGEAFHFVSYVWSNGKVYELDGLQAGPVLVGDCADRNDWLSIAIPHVQSRIEEYKSDSEIRFNLMAITKDRRDGLKARMETIEDSNDPTYTELKAELDDLETRRAMWHQENVRRRHDFIPLGLACLEELARQGKLVKLFEAARSKTRGV